MIKKKNNCFLILKTSTFSLLMICCFQYSFGMTKIPIVRDSLYKNALLIALRTNLLIDSVYIKNMYIVADSLILSEIPKIIDSTNILKLNIRNFNSNKIPINERYFMISPAQFNWHSVDICIRSFKYYSYDTLINEWYSNKECYFIFKYQRFRKRFKYLPCSCLDLMEPQVIDDRVFENIDWNK